MASDIDPRFEPAFQRGYEPMGERVETTTPVVERVESPLVEPAETTPTRNPWIPTLWITAAVFTLAGIAAQFAASLLAVGPTADTPALEYVVPEVFSALAPWLFGAGLATAIATMVIHALRWQPRD